ncbi:ABC-2 type transporter [Anaeromyxobacter dehalogenans 2CP-1]|uniref:ABC-2 type transporter n=1 Tax=Anaeromyxobacter dehalogenans (strain ATCC BAA-258 / DSM 21875 / 2CP-1) TaxID=455488 RepID=B8JH05_ANAD2|nr:ABC transporter permease [Anaeromyxobacter dehalogenans]ACL66642.1 ABC-2 type transporter [Anaeromyxobacter dehalogenans 2CP-1]
MTGPRERTRRSLVRIGAMAQKETIHVLRDPRTLYLALVMPLVMLFLFGYGVTTDLERIPLAVADADRSEASRELVRALTESGELALAGEVAPRDADRLFRRGEAAAVLVIPEDYEERLARRETVELQLLADASDVSSANQLLSKADALVRAESRRRSAALAAPAAPPLSVKVRTLYNPAARSALFLVPGLAAYILAITAILLTTLTVAGEWERGSMEQLFASPVGRLEIVLGKLLPYLVLAMLELLVVIAFGAAVFDVPVMGKPPLLIAMGFFFVVGMLGQGLLVSVLTKNQLLATQVGLISALLPSLLLSGMVFPIENMPVALQLLSRLIPARYMVHALREILLKGNGLDVLWPDLLAVVAFALLVIALSTARFKRRLA